MIIVPAERQNLWGPLAVANFLLGGMGAGAYATAILVSGLSPLARLIGTWSVLLVVVGFLCVAVEAGRPFRGPNVLRMVRSSWMSRELWAGGAFILLVVAEMVAPILWIRTLALLAALVFIFCQGLILLMARGIPAWNHPIVPVLFLTSGLLTGAAFLGMIDDVAGRWTWLTAGLLGLNGLVWVGYLIWPRDRAFLDATRNLRGRMALSGIIGLGHIVPLLLLLLPGDAGPVLAGLFALFGAILLKASLVLRAGQFRPVAFASGPPTRVGGRPS